MFLSTNEPVDAHGNTRNPTKSLCDRYVFNTVLTRAKSLVVVVGSPLVLLNIEKHMIKLYKDKGRCWSVYLKCCLEKGTFIIPTTVEGNEQKRQQFKAHLAARLQMVESPLAVCSSREKIASTARLNKKPPTETASKLFTSNSMAQASVTNASKVKLQPTLSISASSKPDDKLSGDSAPSAALNRPCIATVSTQVTKKSISASNIIASKASNSAGSKASNSVPSKASNSIASKSSNNIASKPSNNVASKASNSAASKPSNKVTSKVSNSVPSKAHKTVSSKDGKTVPSKDGKTVPSKDGKTVSSKDDKTVPSKASHISAFKASNTTASNASNTASSKASNIATSKASLGPKKKQSIPRVPAPKIESSVDFPVSFYQQFL